VVNLRNTFSRQPSAVASLEKDWQNIIWREWRNCEDEEYARHLFDLVVDEPKGWQATAVLNLLGAAFGALGGWLLALLLYPESLTAVIIWAMMLLGLIIIGGVGGLLVTLETRFVGQSSWGNWLQGLIPNTLFGDQAGRLSLDSLYLGLIVALSSAMGVGITGALFFGQTNPQFYIFLVVLVIVLGVGFYLRQWLALINGLVGTLVGWLFGVFFGLGFAQLVGLFMTPLDVANSGRVVGLVVGTSAGLFLGRRAGFIGVLIYQVVVIGLVLAAGANLVLLGWLVGSLFGGVVSAASRMYLPGDKLKFVDAYTNRGVFLWWLGRPFATEVEAALRQHASGDVWQKLLRDLEKQQEQPETAEALWAYLRRPIWTDRFIGRYALAALGGEAIPHLLNVAGDRTHSLRQTAMWLIRSISHETTARLAAEAEQMICPDCLTCCDSHMITQLSLLPIYYGCRICGQSREFLYCPQGVVAVLDSGWTEAQPRQGGFLQRVFNGLASDSPQLKAQAQDNGLLRVNWLARRELFDFDGVEIIRATDEDVERFAVQVGNDTDPVRDARYPHMQCLIVPECRLSENTLRVLRHTFGQVERGEEVAR
jgi:hypothetical protein